MNCMFLIIKILIKYITAKETTNLEYKSISIIQTKDNLIAPATTTTWDANLSKS